MSLVPSLQHVQLLTHLETLRQMNHKSGTQPAGATLQRNHPHRLAHSGLLREMKPVCEMRKLALSILILLVGCKLLSPTEAKERWWVAWNDWRGCAAECGIEVSDRAPQEFLLLHTHAMLHPRAPSAPALFFPFIPALVIGFIVHGIPAQCFSRPCMKQEALRWSRSNQ